jgi:hypothetical protein
VKRSFFSFVALCLVLSLLGGTAYAALAFSDVTTDSWFHGAVAYCIDKGIMKGVTDTTFEPNATIDRTTLVTTLYDFSLMKGFDVSVGEDTNILSYEDAFDIREGAYEAFQWACGSGLLPKPESPALGPNEVMTREQAVTFLYDYAVLYDIDPHAGDDTNILSYDDALQITIEEAYAAFQWACGAGIIIGTSNSTLSPLDNTTRAQLATMMMRLSEK